MSDNAQTFQPVAERPWVIIGCGFTGTRLAYRLASIKAKVWVTRRTRSAVERITADTRACGRISGHVLDLADKAPIQDIGDWLPRGAYLVHTAPPSAASPRIERDLVRCAHELGVIRMVYVSSTGVYPPGDGQWIDEHAPVGPASDRGRARLAAETALLHEARSVGLSAVSLRAVGIYGPGRGVHARLLAGTYRIIGAGDTYVNRVHVDDLGTAIVAAATVEPLLNDVYHVADDQPESSRVYGDAAADIMGVDRPPSVPESSVKPWIVSMLRANRRVSNRRMKRELGVELAYPTWREGLAQVMDEHARTQQASP